MSLRICRIGVHPDPRVGLSPYPHPLDPADRDIIGLVHWEGFSLVEVSRILRMKEGTVRSRYHRAKVRLREQLEDQAGASTPIGSHLG